MMINIPKLSFKAIALTLFIALCVINIFKPHPCTAFVIGGGLVFALLNGRRFNITESTGKERISDTSESAPETNSVISNKVKPEVSHELTPKEKGNRFEEYIVTEISKLKHYNKLELLEWQGDRIITQEDSPTGKLIYPKASSHPDLIYRNVETGEKIAIECKWRSHWGKSAFYPNEEWFSIVEEDKREWKMERYRAFDKSELQLTTYFALGVGWDSERNAPSKEGIIPLSIIKDDRAGSTQSHLKNNTKPFEEIFKISTS